MSVSLVHLVPRMPPEVDGVGDYALNLALTLQAQHQIQSRFIVANPGATFEANCQGFSVGRVDAADNQAMENSLNAIAPTEVLLLHYVGYGYQKRGIPFHLVGTLTRWIQNRERKRLRPRFAVMFHELWSSGQPWQSAFYLHWLQWWLVRSLHRRADVSITSNERMRSLLEEIAPKETVRIPISSNFPIPENYSVQERHIPPLRILIFGQTATRLAAVDAHERLLKALFKNQSLSKVIVAGHGAVASPEPSEDVVRLRSFLPESHVEVRGSVKIENGAQIFMDNDVFLSFYPASLSCKSGVFMAAMACGCPGILCEADNKDGLVPGRHFLACDGSDRQVKDVLEAVRTGALKRIRTAAGQWYSENASWSVTGRKYGELLGHLDSNATVGSL